MHQNSDNQLVNMIFYLKLLLIEYKIIFFIKYVIFFAKIQKKTIIFE
jgi:hypothetical protein